MDKGLYSRIGFPGDTHSELRTESLLRMAINWAPIAPSFTQSPNCLFDTSEGKSRGQDRIMRKDRVRIR